MAEVPTTNLVLLARRPELSPNAIGQLQRVAGNSAVASLLRDRPIAQRCTSEAPCGPCAEEQAATQEQGRKGGNETAKQKGEPVADEQIKTKSDAGTVEQTTPTPVTGSAEGVDGVPVVFATMDATETATDDLRAKAKLCPPAGGKIQTVFPGGRSTAAQIGAMGSCTWGITVPDHLVVTTKTCEDGLGNWTLRVMGVRAGVRTFSRLLAGVTKPTVASSNAANFCTRAHELDVLGVCPGTVYMLAAVKAHERVHIQEWKTSFPTDWPAVKAAIEGLTVPTSGATATQRAATAALRAQPGFTNAMRPDATNFPTFWGIADPNANTDAAERAIVDPRITAICNRAKSRGFGPGACAECSARGIV